MCGHVYQQLKRHEFQVDPRVKLELRKYMASPEPGPEAVSESAGFDLKARLARTPPPPPLTRGPE